MAMEIFRLVGSIFVDSDKADKSLAQTDKKAQGVGSTLAGGIKTAGKWAAGIVAGTATAVTAVAGFSKQFAEAYADQEQLVGGVETLFKDSAGKVQEYASQAYMTAGMSANEYMETVTGFSASLLQSLGGDTDKAAEAANLALTDMSDNANKMGTSLDSIKTAYAGFAKGQYTMLDNLKLGYGGTKGEMERLLADAQKISGVEYNIDNLSDVYEAIHVIQTEMDITGTTAKEAGSTISGSVGALQARLENMKASIGEALAPTIKRVLQLVTDYMPRVEDLITKLVPILADVLDKALPPLMDLADQIFPVLLDLINEFAPVLTLIAGEIFPIISGILADILPFLVELVQKVLPVAINIIQALLPVISEILTLLSPILDLVMTLLEPLLDLIDFILPPIAVLLKGLAQVITAVLKPVISWLSSFLGTTLRNSVESFKDVVRAIPQAFRDAWAGIQTAWSAVTGWFQRLGDGIKGIFTRVGDGIKGVFKAPLNTIISGINTFIRGINKITIPDWVPGVGGYGFHINEIPQLAKGGVLEKGQTGLLEGTGAEAVVPLENNAKWVSAVARDMERGVGGEKTEKLLTAILAELEDIAKVGIYLDSKKLVGALAGPMDKELGRVSARKVRT